MSRDDHRPARAADHGLRVVDHLGHRHADRRLVAEEHLAERIAHEQQRDPGLVEELRGREVVGGQHRDPRAVGVQLRDVVDRQPMRIRAVWAGVALMLAPGGFETRISLRARRRARPARRPRGRGCASATARLGQHRQLVLGAVGGQDRHPVRVRPEAGARLRDVVGDEEVDALAAQLLGGALERAGLGREADEDRPRRARARRAAGDASAGCPGVGSSSRLSADPRSSFRSRRIAGRKSATAAAMTRASKPAGASASARAASRSAVDSASTTVRAASSGSGTSRLAAMSVTRAPRSSAASATATPIFPVERFPMKRTGSMGSRGATGGHDEMPARQVGVPGRGVGEGGRAAGSAARTGRPADGRHHGIHDRRQVRQPADPGLPATRAARSPARRWRSRSRRAGGRRWPAWRGGRHMSPSIAGATTTGAALARQVAVTTSAASPLAIAPSQCAVAGATTIASAAVADDDVADAPVGGAGRARRSRPGGGTAPRASAGRRTAPPTASA